jgi:hypothetical protein
MPRAIANIEEIADYVHEHNPIGEGLQRRRRTRYLVPMNKLLQKAVAEIENLPESEQELAAKFLLDFANPDAGRYHLTGEQIAEVERSRREVREGKVASDKEMERVWRGFGL